MFTYLNKQGVQSSKGFIVQRTGRFSAEYKEGSKMITLDLESGILDDGGFCKIVKSTNFSHWDDGSPILKEKQSEIIRNFIEAMKFQGMGVIIE